MTTFQALADPTRRRILDLLLDQPRFVGELVDLLQMSQPLISKHLRVLREVGLVQVKEEARKHWYVLRAEPLAEIDDWLKPYRDQMEARYQRLDALLETLKQEEKRNAEDESDR